MLVVTRFEFLIGRWRHPEGPRFRQRAEGSPLSTIEGRPLDPQLLPRVMRGIGDDLLAIGSDGHGKFNCLTIFFLVVIRFSADLPVLSTIEMLDDSHLDCLFLMVTNPDLECLSR